MKLTSPITASWAYSKDNVTNIAAVPVEDERYTVNMFRLRWEDYDDTKLLKLSRAPNARFSVAGVGAMISQLAGYIPFQDHPRVIAVKNSVPWKGIQSLAKFVANLEVFGRRRGLGLGWTSADRLAREEIKDTFTSMLRLLKAQALETSDIDITDAIIAVPDFFNPDLHDIVKEACTEVGISCAGPLARTMMGALGAGIELENGRVLVLDVDHFHMGMILNQHDWEPRFFAFDQFATSTLYGDLLNLVIKADDNLGVQIKLGADRERLRSALGLARAMITGFPSQLLERSVDEPEHQDPIHEEWPLDLKGWWIGGEGTALLRWRDVQLAEEEYVRRLSGTIDAFVRVLGNMPLSSTHLPVITC